MNVSAVVQLLDQIKKVGNHELAIILKTGHIISLHQITSLIISDTQDYITIEHVPGGLIPQDTSEIYYTHRDEIRQEAEKRYANCEIGDYDYALGMAPKKTTIIEFERQVLREYLDVIIKSRPLSYTVVDIDQISTMDMKLTPSS